MPISLEWFRALSEVIVFRMVFTCYLAEHPQAVVDCLLAVLQQDIALFELALASSILWSSWHDAALAWCSAQAVCWAAASLCAALAVVFASNIMCTSRSRNGNRNVLMTSPECHFQLWTSSSKVCGNQANQTVRLRTPVAIFLSHPESIRC